MAKIYARKVKAGEIVLCRCLEITVNGVIVDPLAAMNRAS
jgi:hypothetical protein